MEYKTMKQCIKEKYDTLSMQEKKVAKYIIDNYQQSILLSSAELAQQSGVSNTAVIRFAKALGFHGFLEAGDPQGICPCSAGICISASDGPG